MKSQPLAFPNATRRKCSLVMYPFDGPTFLLCTCCRYRCRKAILVESPRSRTRWPCSCWRSRKIIDRVSAWLRSIFRSRGSMCMFRPPFWSYDALTPTSEAPARSYPSVPSFPVPQPFSSSPPCYVHAPLSASSLPSPPPPPARPFPALWPAPLSGLVPPGARAPCSEPFPSGPP